MGHNESANGVRNKLEHLLDRMHLELSEIMESYRNCLQQYTDSMQSSLNAKEYFNESEFLTLHHNSRNRSLQQVCNTSFELIEMIFLLKVE